ncbi:hypothetical protein ACVXG7_28750 [Enterobacter hormaechei]
MVMILSHLEKTTITEKINDGFATQSSIHRFTVRFFPDSWQQWEGDKVSQTPPLLLRSRNKRTCQAVIVLAVTGNSNEQAKLITVKTDVLYLSYQYSGRYYR